MVFVLVALLFGAIFSLFLGSDMVQTGSINAKQHVFSRIFMQLECKIHVFSRDFGLQIRPGSLLGLLGFTHAKNRYFSYIFVVRLQKTRIFSCFWAVTLELPVLMGTFF